MHQTPSCARGAYHGTQRHRAMSIGLLGLDTAFSGGRGRNQRTHVHCVQRWSARAGHCVQRWAQLFPVVAAPANAVAAMLAVRQGTVRDAAANMVLEAGGEAEVPEAMVRVAVDCATGSQDPSAGSSSTAPQQAEEHDISGGEDQVVPPGVTVPKVPAWTGLVATLTRQFESLQHPPSCLQHPQCETNNPHLRN